MANDAHVALGDLEGSRDVAVELVLAERGANHPASALGELRVAVLEVIAANIERSVPGAEIGVGEKVAFHELAAAVALASSLASQVAADPESERGHSRGILNATFAQRLDQEHERVVSEVIGGRRAQASHREGAHRGHQSSADLTFGRPVARDRPEHQRVDLGR